MSEVDDTAEDLEREGYWSGVPAFGHLLDTEGSDDVLSGTGTLCGKPLNSIGRILTPQQASGAPASQVCGECRVQQEAARVVAEAAKP